MLKPQVSQEDGCRDNPLVVLLEVQFVLFVDSNHGYSRDFSKSGIVSCMDVGFKALVIKFGFLIAALPGMVGLGEAHVSPFRCTANVSE
jgi:hypothetical protein